MPVLPSGLRFTFSAQPFWDLVSRVSDEFREDGILWTTPEFLLIQKPDDLRQYIQILWVVPESADMRTHPDLTRHLKQLPHGWGVVGSGCTFDCLPEQLDAKDRNALCRLWKFLRDRPPLRRLMEVVRRQHGRMAGSPCEHYKLLASWFPRGQPSEWQPAITTKKFSEF
jgi:hypothetical protein